jgi:hypothetical protein
VVVVVAVASRSLPQPDQQESSDAPAADLAAW